MNTERTITDQGFGIYTVDTGFLRPALAASHLVVEQGRAAFIDVGPAHARDRLLQALTELGMAREQVDWVIVTHVHLDHAGGAGALMAALPNARLLVHPRGARHMIDPSRLVGGASAVYGEGEVQRQFGDVLPVAAERVVEAGDQSEWSLNGRPLRILDTPGHAKHHFCVYDERSRGFFTGDTFGLSYRELDTEQGAFIFPTTSPVQFDPDALRASVDRLLSYRPQRMFLTHFGCVTEPLRLAEALLVHVDRFVDMALIAQQAGSERGVQLRQQMTDWLLESLRLHGCTLSRDQMLELMGMDIELNAQGLECWLDQTAGNG